MAGPDLVVFDCDGVLVDSEPIAVAVDVRVLADLGWPLSAEEVVERFVGRSDADMAAAIEAHLGRPLPPGWDDAYRPWYRAAFDADLRPVAGIEAALDAIAAAGVPTCVASSGSHEKVEANLRLTGLWDRFAGRVFTTADVARGKPAPDLFLHAAASTGAEPGRCVVVEDSPFGLEAALAAGMRALAYAGGVVPVARLRRPGVTLFDDMRDLPALVGARPPARRPGRS